MDKDIRWLVVTPSYPAGEAQVLSYLYTGSASHFGTTNVGFGDIVVILVHGRPGRADVESFATYQADRLRSGLHATTVHETYADACAKVVEHLNEQEVRANG